MKLFDLYEGTKEFQSLKKNRIKLTDKERKQCLKSKAVWHPCTHKDPVCAIWKSKRSNGKVVYVCNTHRIYQTASTLKGAIRKFHDVVKDTA